MCRVPESRDEPEGIHRLARPREPVPLRGMQWHGGHGHADVAAWWPPGGLQALGARPGEARAVTGATRHARTEYLLGVGAARGGVGSRGRE